MCGTLCTLYASEARSSRLSGSHSATKSVYPSLAKKLVEDHLAAEGIQLAGVRPAATTTNLPVYMAILVVLISIYLIIVRVVVPIFRKRKLRKMVPEGFWLCENCGTISPDLSKVCIECQHPRKKQGRSRII